MWPLYVQTHVVQSVSPNSNATLFEILILHMARKSLHVIHFFNSLYRFLNGTSILHSTSYNKNDTLLFKAKAL